ncbi:MAG: site-specific integrase [Muribaculaceae bacterium]|nr:site-specific integrase [Muribaculaceae bacterium]
MKSIELKFSATAARRRCKESYSLVGGGEKGSEKISEITVFQYIRRQAERMKQLGKLRTSETYLQTLSSFMKFRKGVDLYFDMLDADMVQSYENHMRKNYLSRNTTSFYMRVLRCIYNRAVDDNLARQGDIFRQVYTGVDKTSKRAITLNEIRLIKQLDLSDRPALDYARDVFMFSFYMRGMSFVDIAYLRKKDLSNGYISYIRRKTAQMLTIRWEKSMQEIIDKYPQNTTQYLFPIITRQDGTERRQYLNKMLIVNRRLKQVGRLAGITTPLSMYVSRHSWASIANAKNIPLSVISEGMGHDSEETTRIYLSSIQINRIDEANSQILSEL